MSTSQEEIELTRDVTATLIPHGEEFNLSREKKSPLPIALEETSPS